MAIIKQGGSNPHAGLVTTTMGLRGHRPPRCLVCGERREGQLYTVNANGQEVCADCASPKNRVVLAPTCGECGDEGCACTDKDDVSDAAE